MTDREALLRAICESPEDDAPRLIYADWLEEHGDARQAEFIRVQIELAKCPNDESLTRALTAALEWCSDFRKWRFVAGHWPKLNLSRFIRGFNTFWGGSATEFLAAAPTHWQLGPVQTVNVWIQQRKEATTELAQEVAASEWLHYVRELRLSGRWANEKWVGALARSPAASQWRQLEIEGHASTEPACRALASSVLALTVGTLFINRSLGVSAQSRSTLLRAFGDRCTLNDTP